MRAGQPLEPCQEDRTLIIELDVDTLDVVGSETVAVTRVAGGLAVVQSHGFIGSVRAQDTSFLADCLEQGYTIVGRVERVGPGERSAVIVVHGIPPNP